MDNPLKRYVDQAGRGARARLAHDLSLSKGYIGDLVSGRRAPSLELARRLEKATDGAVAFVDWK